MENSTSDSETASILTRSTLIASYALISVFMILSVLFIALYITPQYVNVYEDMDVALPLLTKTAVQGSRYAIALASGMGLLFVLGGAAGYRTPKLLPILITILFSACFVLYSVAMIALNLPLVNLIQNLQ